jgi:hypothetical protein
MCLPEGRLVVDLVPVHVVELVVDGVVGGVVVEVFADRLSLVAREREREREWG